MDQHAPNHITALLIDMSKAFGRLNPARLCDKLRSRTECTQSPQGLRRGLMLWWVKSNDFETKGYKIFE